MGDASPETTAVRQEVDPADRELGSGNVAATCRYYGISRTLFYKWRRRFDEIGPAGLADLSRRPKTSPRATDPEVVGRIIYLRQHYHFGPAKMRCTSSVTTTSRSRSPGSGAS